MKEEKDQRMREWIEQCVMPTPSLHRLRREFGMEQEEQELWAKLDEGPARPWGKFVKGEFHLFPVIRSSPP